MSEELSTALAERIKQAHQEATEAADSARNGIDYALNKAADVGMLIAEAGDTYKAKLNEWLRAYVPTLSVEQADIYRGIHNVRKKRECSLPDTRQLKLIGIIGGDSDEGKEQSSQSSRATKDHWVKWTAHVSHHFEDMDKTKPIESLEPFERKAIALQLQPIVKIYERAAGIRVIDV